jgi:crossover junction endodeoxyribonuclease RuvC
VIAGLDLSLTGTGVAIYSEGGIETSLIKTTGKKTDTLRDTALRLAKIEQGVYQLVGDCDLAVIEAPSFGSTGGAAHERAGLWWGVVDMLFSLGINVAKVAPTTLKAYVTGDGKADKDEVLAAVIRKYPQANVANNNVADAVGLMAMGCRYYDMPLEVENAKTIKSMKAVVWP